MTTSKVSNDTKSILDLQSALSRQLDMLSDGQTTPAVANAVVNTTAAYLRTVKMQMDYAKQTGRTPYIPLLLTEEPER